MNVREWTSSECEECGAGLISMVSKHPSEKGWLCYSCSFKELLDNPILPTDAEERKMIPIYSGVIAYFPRALAAVAKVNFKGNEQHNPGAPLHWDRSKSGDELDALMRHIVEGDWDAVAWRALANLEKQLEKGDA